jgi:GNAT acetyltransferase-like protein
MALEFFTFHDLPPAVAEEIVRFLDSQDTGHPFQWPRWAGAGSRFVLLRQAGRICWFASCGTQFPLSTRLPWLRALTVNRGPVCDDIELWRAGLDELAQRAHNNRFVYLDAAPDRHPMERGGPSVFGPDWKPLGEGRVSLRLALTKAEDEILAGLRKSTRYEVRRAERAGVTIEPSKQAADVEEFLRLYSRLGGRKGFATDSPDHLRGVLQWLMTEPERGALLLARDHAAIAGGAVIVRSGKRCWYVWGASDQHDRFSTGQLLQWRAILWAKSQGCKEYDFGGYTPDATSGPAWFKEGFGGEVVHFVPAHRRIMRRGYCRLSETLAKLRSTMFLASRQPPRQAP